MTISKLLKLTVAGMCLTLIGCEGDVSYSDDIRPILEASCNQCHDQAAEGEAVSGLSLKTYDDLMQGTQYGKVVVPGSALSSALYLTVAASRREPCTGQGCATERPPDRPDRALDQRGGA